MDRTTAEELERRLSHDLRRLGDRLADAEFCAELYRTLTNRVLRRRGVDDGAHVTLSWSRAEELVNDLRAAHDRPPLQLAQTGGEGFAGERVLVELERLGWDARPLNTSRHDDGHLERPTGEPRTPPTDRFERAHADAEAERRRKVS